MNAMLIIEDGITVMWTIVVENSTMAGVEEIVTTLKQGKIVRLNVNPMFCYTKGSIESDKYLQYLRICSKIEF